MLWRGRKGQRYPAIESNQLLFLNYFEKNFFGPSANTIRVVGQHGQPFSVRNNPPSDESRAEFAVEIVDELRNGEAEQALKRLLNALREKWGVGEADREDLLSLLQILARRGAKKSDASFKTARRLLLQKLENIGDFRAAAEFLRTYPDEASDAEATDLKTKFFRFAQEYCDEWNDENDPDWLRQVAANVEYVGERLKAEVSTFTAPLYERADEVEQERAEREPEGDDPEDWEPTSSSTFADDVDAMFNGLRDEISASLKTD